MQRKMGWVLFALLLLSGMPLLCSESTQAASTAVTVTPSQSDGTVAVTVSDAELKGKEISVICYAPGASGAYNDLAGNKEAIVYLNQYTINGTLSFNFKVKKQLVREYIPWLSHQKKDRLQASSALFLRINRLRDKQQALAEALLNHRFRIHLLKQKRKFCPRRKVLRQNLQAERK